MIKSKIIVFKKMSSSNQLLHGCENMTSALVNDGNGYCFTRAVPENDLNGVAGHWLIFSRCYKSVSAAIGSAVRNGWSISI